jgi:hypothetical protein
VRCISGLECRPDILFCNALARVTQNDLQNEEIGTARRTAMTRRGVDAQSPLAEPRGALRIIATEIRRMSYAGVTYPALSGRSGTSTFVTGIWDEASPKICLT